MISCRLASQLAAFVCFHTKCLPLFYTKPSTKYNSCSFHLVYLSTRNRSSQHHSHFLSSFPSLSIFIHLVHLNPLLFWNSRRTGIAFILGESGQLERSSTVNERFLGAFSSIHKPLSSHKPLFILSSAVKALAVWEMKLVTPVIFVPCLSKHTRSNCAIYSPSLIIVPLVFLPCLCTVSLSCMHCSLELHLVYHLLT